MTTAKDKAPFHTFIAACRSAIEAQTDEATTLQAIRAALTPLLGRDDWLPETHRKPRADRYAQYPLFVSPQGDFSVVSFVWSPGQWTPIHDHTVWGVIGIHQGVERTEAYREGADGLVLHKTIDATVGQTGAVSPAIGDIHRVGNVSDQLAISIHAYGGDIGRIERHVYDEQGTQKRFVSGYEPANVLLNDW
ncbi:MAG: cysteine dioxygenase [Burkholderiaceae bacterium]